MKKYLVSYGELSRDLRYYFSNLILESPSDRADDILDKLQETLTEFNKDDGTEFFDAVLINFWEI